MLKTVSSITNAIGALNYKGTWNASTNTPTIVSGTGTKGDYYVVSVAGTTTIDGISNWGVGDWIAFNGSTWQRVEGGADLNGVNLSVSGTTTLSGLTASTALALDGSKDVVSVTNTGSGDNVLATTPSFVSTIGVGGATAAASGAGITFPATASPSSDPNTLDDYEEGTYTPTFSGFTLGNGTITVAIYIKVGTMVYCSGRVTWGSTTAATSGDFGVSVPIAVTLSGRLGGGSAQLGDAGTGTYVVAAFYPPYTFNAIKFGDGTGTGFVSGTNPFTWTTNDSFTWAIVYSI